jgi:hypothetical protein
MMNLGNIESAEKLMTDQPLCKTIHKIKVGGAHVQPIFIVTLETINSG